jgi:hypothetical protein
MLIHRFVKSWIIRNLFTKKRNVIKFKAKSTCEVKEILDLKQMSMITNLKERMLKSS